MGTHVAKGTIRRTAPGVWEVLENDTHRHEGIASVVAYPEYLLVNFAFEADFVITCAVTPDEKMAVSTIIPGASVGLTSATIHFGKNGARVLPEQITNAQANIWVCFELGSDEGC